MESNSSTILKQTDGTLYIEAFNHAPEGNNVISLNINSDGAPLTKSTKHSIWPVLATIVELDDSSRDKFENVIFLGFWLNKVKPPALFFEKCLVKLIELINISSNHNGKCYYQKNSIFLFDMSIINLKLIRFPIYFARSHANCRFACKVNDVKYQTIQWGIWLHKLCRKRRVFNSTSQANLSKYKCNYILI